MMIDEHDIQLSMNGIHAIVTRCDTHAQRGKVDSPESCQAAIMQYLVRIMQIIEMYQPQ
jgi:hypothetical protein